MLPLLPRNHQDHPTTSTTILPLPMVAVAGAVAVPGDAPKTMTTLHLAMAVVVAAAVGAAVMAVGAVEVAVVVAAAVGAAVMAVGAGEVAVVVMMTWASPMPRSCASFLPLIGLCPPSGHTPGHSGSGGSRCSSKSRRLMSTLIARTDGHDSANCVRFQTMRLTIRVHLLKHSTLSGLLPST